MQIRPGIRLVYQIARVVVQTSALFLDLDDLSGGRMSRVFIKGVKHRHPSPPAITKQAKYEKQVYGSDRGVKFHGQRKPMPRKY